MGFRQILKILLDDRQIHEKWCITQDKWINSSNGEARARSAVAFKLSKKAKYKKHHPPMLGDEVWWLEKIGKDGAFHKKLAYEGVNTVQDFLKMLVVDPPKLRNVTIYI
ncbi:hypothetical protein GOBAR_AA16439 [Gossypium barbadense]|uniref:Calmodulin binding protein central domain-containing protein n=1 Tax=Gossypium barbadense TaxID=3634 RepID=A0A2P5XLJ2_GOSBA|nr:hypothetical protein GOBAR_AA16439 [Gossypium barbadense]